MEKKFTIILTDDDEDDRDFFRMAVDSSQTDYNLLLFQDGVDLKNYLSANPPVKPDVIFLDINMPLLNGFQCLEFIREIYNPDEVPVVMYTTSRNQADREESARLGANQYLVKPNDIKDLKIAVQQVIEKYKFSA